MQMWYQEPAKAIFHHTRVQCRVALACVAHPPCWKMQTLTYFYTHTDTRSHTHTHTHTLTQALGTGFDCASKGELRMMLKLGVHPSNIIFAHPCKRTSDILFAKVGRVCVYAAGVSVLLLVHVCFCNCLCLSAAAHA